MKHVCRWRNWRVQIAWTSKYGQCMSLINDRRDEIGFKNFWSRWKGSISDHWWRQSVV